MKARPHIISLLFVISLGVTPVSATTVNQVGTYNNWATTWTAINGLNDGADTANASLDFVGNANAPGAAYAVNDDYYMFRMQLNVDSATSFSNAFFLMIDLAGGTTPDYAITWDAKSADPAKHGMEMQVYNSGASWNQLRFEDIDNAPNEKSIMDINGNGRTTDGYIRTIDNISTGESFGNVTWIEFAISRDYLVMYVPALSDVNNWNIQFGNIANATDHNPLDTDIAGFVSLTNTISSNDFTKATNSAASPVPEPGTVMLMGSGVLGMLGLRRRELLAYFKR